MVYFIWIIVQNVLILQHERVLLLLKYKKIPNKRNCI